MHTAIVRVSCAGLATRRQDIDRTHARDGERDSTIYVCARVSESPLAVCRHTTTLGSPQLFSSESNSASDFAELTADLKTTDARWCILLINLESIGRISRPNLGRWQP